jgi:acetylglutamate kinase
VTRALVLKVGGELVEESGHLTALVAAVAAVSGGDRGLVVVHGGGREIDRALERAGIRKQQVDGLRITDDATLGVVVSVLAGVVNPRFVAALNAAGVRAVGLTGADAACVRSKLAPPHRAADGQLVDLGRVGIPDPGCDVRLIDTLLGAGFVPVLASIGVDGAGQLLNVNADTLAGFLAARLGARRLIIAGATPGVLDAGGRTMERLDPPGIAALIAEKTATAGMIAKLRACEQALAHGVDEVFIVDGRDHAPIHNAARGEASAGTTTIKREEVRFSRSAALPAFAKGYGGPP